MTTNQSCGRQHPWLLSFFAWAALVCLGPGPAALGAADKPAPAKIRWVEGPAKAAMESMAEITIPEGFRFADANDTRRLLKAEGEPTSGREMGMIVSDKERFCVFFDFSKDGYVKDDDKDKLNADKLLKSIIRGNDAANEEREKMGSAPLRIIGWEKEPRYDGETHHLEWAIRAESGGRPILNYNTRLLGRKGVMEVVLVCSPTNLPTTLPIFKQLLGGYSYKTGEKYAEFKPGDKVAKYGLAALVTGGAVAVAAKTGLLTGLLLLFKKAWKLLVIAVVAVVGFFKRIIFGTTKSTTGGTE